MSTSDFDEGLHPRSDLSGRFEPKEPSAPEVTLAMRTYQAGYVGPVALAEILTFESSDSECGHVEARGEDEDLELAAAHEGWMFCTQWADWVLDDRRADDQFASLKRSMAADGQQTCVIVYVDQRLNRPILHEGHHRVAAAVDLGWDSIAVSFEPVPDDWPMDWPTAP